MEASPSNAESLIEALVQFGFGSLDFGISDFLEPDTIIQLGYPPNRIDLLTSLTGVDFQQCHSQRVDVLIDEVLVSFINLENLRTNKKSSGRAQDLADFENLK